MGMSPERLAQVDRRLRTSADAVTSILVARHGRIVYERYYRGLRPDQPVPVLSITKSFVSALVGIALGEGRLGSVDERLGQLLPVELGPGIDPRARRVTLRDLLTMTSGYCCGPAVEPPDHLQALVYRPFVSEPGTRFRYDNGDANLVAAILGQAVGRSAAEYARSRLFEPLGMGPTEWESDREGNSRGAEGLRIRPRDLLSFGQLYLEEGRWRGRQIVPASWIGSSTRAHVRLGADIGYGFYWWVVRQGRLRAFEALGYGGQEVAVFPALDLVLVITAGGEDWEARARLTRLVLRAVIPSR